MKYRIMLESFEGPMDLLLHLIEKSKINIYDIEINEITEQYINHINSMEKFNLELNSEFLVMASILLQIKSDMLIPKKTVAKDSETDEIESRDQLIKRLIEYKEYKTASNQLKDFRKIQEKIFFKKKEELAVNEKNIFELGKVDINLLLNTINTIISRNNSSLKKQKNIIFDKIKREEYTLRDGMDYILKELSKNSKILFSDLIIDNDNIGKIVIFFLSVLELSRNKNIILEQSKNFSDLLLINIKPGRVKNER